MTTEKKNDNRMVLDVKEFEFFENGKFNRTVNGYRELKKYLDNLDNWMLRHNMIKLKSSSGSASYRIYVNYIEQKCSFIAWREWRGFYDCTGNKIYFGDWLVDSENRRVDILESSDSDKMFVYRVFGDRFGEYTDYPIENMDFVKEQGVRVHKPVFEICCAS